ncbi:BtpA/SgcQ family protein [Mesorhizobium sp. KR1-2]|uniref:BtpA/SgcQ family protein n=1 Tax=Mesorhizobium sp. KR1-2 TaxID=3156609 RepID=UPI0032B4ECB1
MNNRFSEIFVTPKPILGMLHLTGASAEERLDIARKETETLIANGVDGVIVENYFGDKDDVRNVLEWLETRNPDVLVGLNVLRDHHLAFELAKQFRVDFIQMDSVAGHLPPEEDKDFAAELAELRGQVSSVLFGGVRFKYQPVKSGRSEPEDLVIGKSRCDAIVVTSDATGQVTDLDKVRRFRATTGSDFPLLIGAGLTAGNAREQLLEADGAIVGSYFKDTYTDTGIVEGSHVAELIKAVESLRAENAAVALRMGA